MGIYLMLERWPTVVGERNQLVVHDVIASLTDKGKRVEEALEGTSYPTIVQVFPLEQLRS